MVVNNFKIARSCLNGAQYVLYKKIFKKTFPELGYFFCTSGINTGNHSLKNKNDNNEKALSSISHRRIRSM